MHASATPSSTRASGVGSQSRLTAGSTPKRVLAHVASRLRRPRVAISLACALVALIGVADYVTGYEVRLAILYILPVALATWAGGRGWGFLIVAIGTGTWAASFATQHAYSRDLYFYWDGVVMAATLLLFVELITRLRAALARSDERFVRVLNEMYAAVYVTDDDGRVLFANRRLARLMGSEARTPTTAEIAARFVAIKEEPASAAAGASQEFRFTGAEARDPVDGRWYVVQTGVIPWVDLRRVQLNVMTDITDQKQAQALRDEHQAALHDSSRLVNLAEAATTLAHELNQPLVAIVGYNAACIRMLEAGTVDLPAFAAAMKKCRAQAVRAGEIIHRMRDLARRRTPRFAACNLNAMIREQLEGMENELTRAGVEVEFVLAELLPLVQADRILVQQVIVNLVQNAIDAMRNGDPAHRRLRVASCLGEAGTVTVTVADRGDGIAPSVSERLYSTFFTTKISGLGLGLSICRSIVELHGGRIWHDSNPGGGTAFNFTLPVDKP